LPVGADITDDQPSSLLVSTRQKHPLFSFPTSSYLTCLHWLRITGGAICCLHDRRPASVPVAEARAILTAGYGRANLAAGLQGRGGLASISGCWRATGADCVLIIGLINGRFFGRLHDVAVDSARSLFW
jgi:hypothetical protein